MQEVIKNYQTEEILMIKKLSASEGQAPRPPDHDPLRVQLPDP